MTKKKLLLALALLVLVPSFSLAATITLSPSSTSVNVNSTFTVNVLLDTSGQGAYGVDINRLHFNPALLQVVDADGGTAGVQIGAGTLMSVTSTNTADNSGGTIQFSQLANFGTTFNGTGTLATITFRAISAGTASVTFDFTNGSGTDTNVAGLGTDLLTSVGTGTYTLSVLDTTPPTLSNGAPTGTLVYTTTSTTMSVTTNENATCRYSTVAGTAYASMTNTFTTTGGTSHSTTLSGLTSNTTYTRYVRCQDTVGNPDTTDYVVTFSIAAAPDTTPPTLSAVVASSITSTGAIITWTTNENSDSQVDYGLTNAYGQSSAINASQVTSHSVTLSGLSANTTYHYRVKSRDAAGNLATGGDQTFSTATLPDTTAPSVPTGLASSGVTQTQATLTWNASIDTAAGGQSASGVSGYQVWRGGIFVATSTPTSYTNTGLSSGTTYSYQVAAFDVAGNISARTSSINVTTQTPTPIQRQITLILEGAPVNSRNVTGSITYINPFDSSSLGQTAITTNTSGQVTVTLPFGFPATINIRPTVTGYLSRLISGVDTTSTSVLSITSPNQSAGDFNGDQIINSLDFSLMNTNWLSTNALTDVNKDSIVNSLDFAYMSNNWLSIGQ